MTVLLADRLKVIKPSATLLVSARANRLRSEGLDVINLGVGEPDFNTPEAIKQAAVDAINANFTRYTAVSGIADLKQAICAKLVRDNQLHYTPSEIIVSTGLKQALFNLMLALLNPTDEVIIPAPYWVSYPEMVALAGGTAVIIETTLQQNLKITAAQLAAAITPKTKLLILNSPSNPSGMAYTHAELQQIAEVLRAHPHVYIATDDMYEKIYWGAEPFVNIVTVCPALKPRCIVLNGVSKTYAMTGWRIGYAAACPELIQGMDIIQSQSTSSANSIAQKAAVAALNGPQDCVAEMSKAYQARHQLVYDRLSLMRGVQPLYAQGTFYSFPYVQPLIERLGVKDDVALCELLLNEALVATLPGSACGTPGHIRLSFALGVEALSQALDRIARIAQ